MNRSAPVPRIAVTMGDPAGIGPEIVLRLLADRTIAEICTPIVFGDAAVLIRVANACALPIPTGIVGLEDWTAALESQGPSVVDFRNAGPTLRAGRVDGHTGAAAYAYIEKAIEAASSGLVDAVTTGPIHKEALRAAGISFPGHTEIFAALTGAQRSCMMLAAEALTCSFVTTHVGYRDVPGLLTTERIVDVIGLSAEAMRTLKGRDPRIVVCGLNPHAGEHGLFGAGEEERIIAPAVEAARSKGLAVEGPMPPDTAFLPRRRAAVDVFVCMYHDQGHIPLKALAFESAVNITLGLPIIRTSVDHGTALDIAWKGIAEAESLRQAVLLATRLAAGGETTPRTI